MNLAGGRDADRMTGSRLSGKVAAKWHPDACRTLNFNMGVAYDPSHECPRNRGRRLLLATRGGGSLQSSPAAPWWWEPTAAAASELALPTLHPGCCDSFLAGYPNRESVEEERRRCLGGP